MNLFIIGNGFDRAHGLPTSYINFRNYLEDEDWQYLVDMEALYDCIPESRREWAEKRLWQEFENNLSAINEAKFIDGGEYRWETGGIW